MAYEVTGPDRVPYWVHFAEVPPTDEEPWLWTCGDCGLVMRRDDIAAHRADEARRSAGVIVWMLGALAVAAFVALLVILARWPR